SPRDSDRSPGKAMARRSNCAPPGPPLRRSACMWEHGWRWWGCWRVCRPGPRTAPCTAREGADVAECRVISDGAGFEDACRGRAQADGGGGFVLERACGFRYSLRGYLVQVYRRGAGVFLCEPPAIGDLSARQRAIGDVGLGIHAASRD